MSITQEKRKRINDFSGYPKKRIRGVSSVSEVWEPRESAEVARKPPPKSKVLSGTSLVFPMTPEAPMLPKFDGPKMRPFKSSDVEVCFVRDIGTNAMHSNVFEVLINSKPYALKLFKTYEPEYGPDIWEWREGGRNITSAEMWAFHKPFNCECRAYARMDECGISDRFWKCYGYVRLPGEARQELYRITGLPAFYWQVRVEPEWSHKATWTLPGHLSWPIYGLVKELAPRGKPAFDPKARQVRSMRADLKALHKAGIVNTDIADRNYILGRLIDFSHSLTNPHIWMKPNNPKFNKEFFKSTARADMQALSFNLHEHGIENQVFHHYHSNPGVLTRSNRRWRLKEQRVVKPLYELGVREPSPCFESSNSDFGVQVPLSPAVPILTASGRDFGES